MSPFESFTSRNLTKRQDFRIYWRKEIWKFQYELNKNIPENHVCDGTGGSFGKYFRKHRNNLPLVKAASRTSLKKYPEELVNCSLGALCVSLNFKIIFFPQLVLTNCLTDINNCLQVLDTGLENINIIARLAHCKHWFPCVIFPLVLHGSFDCIKSSIKVRKFNLI